MDEAGRPRGSAVEAVIGRCGICGERHAGRLCPGHLAKGRRALPAAPAAPAAAEFLEIREAGGAVENMRNVSSAGPDSRLVVREVRKKHSRKGGGGAESDLGGPAASGVAGGDKGAV